MGAMCANGSGNSEDKKRSKQIDKNLRAKVASTNEVKLLLLGAGGAGKSTFVRQLENIHGEVKTDSERLEDVSTIHGNVWRAAHALVSAADRFKYEMEGDIEDLANFIRKNTVGIEETVLDEDAASKLEKLWNSAPIQKNLSQEFRISIGRLNRILFQRFKAAGIARIPPHRRGFGSSAEKDHWHQRELLLSRKT